MKLMKPNFWRLGEQVLLNLLLVAVYLALLAICSKPLAWDSFLVASAAFWYGMARNGEAHGWLKLLVRGPEQASRSR